MPRGTGRTRRRIGWPLIATLLVVAPLGWLWQTSRVPATYSVMDMGYADLGGGDAALDHTEHTGHLEHEGGQVSDADPSDDHGGAARPRLVTDLIVDPDRPADVIVDLVARQEPVRVGGIALDGFTLNGTSPGPQVRARQGQLVEVHLHNTSVPEGVTLHWHGVDVPNAMDGVAGVTQDAVPVGGAFVYRFVAGQVGSFWYHAHQLSHAQVAGGLFGSLVITPPGPASTELDVTALAHTYGGTRTINGRVGDLDVPARPGQRVRVRVTNTDNAPLVVWADGLYRVLAVDGTDLHGPSAVRDRSLNLGAGGRADLEVVTPAAGLAIRVQLSKATAVVVGSPSVDAPAAPQPAERLDLLTYGTPASMGFDPRRPDRHFDYVIGRRLGFVRGRPGMWWSINGHLYPHVPMFVVSHRDIVTMRIENRSSAVHPMHLHGHHLVVLARDGRPSTGSPWWVDSLDVQPRETYDVAFAADQPGLWMDHCHNLEHAEDGMVAHLMYEGVDTPFRIGDGPADNTPE